MKDRILRLLLTVATIATVAFAGGASLRGF
jgi:hypothetical protein